MALSLGGPEYASPARRPDRVYADEGRGDQQPRIINGQDTVRVAGWANGGEPPSFINDGLLWEQVNGAWNGWNLNDLVPADDFKVIAAYDVNAMDQAWIVGVGVRSGSNVQRAILLTPLKDCPEDFEPAGGNATVNIDDLVALLGAFGPCPEGVLFCDADVNGNFSVNIDTSTTSCNCSPPLAIAPSPRRKGAADPDHSFSKRLLPNSIRPSAISCWSAWIRSVINKPKFLTH